MTKKDYILIAEVLKNYRIRKEQGLIDNDLIYLIQEFSYQLEKQNKKFDILKFAEYIRGK